MRDLSNILLVTPSSRCDRLLGRSPLLHLTLPVECIPNHLRYPTGRVWWAERREARVVLRGYGQVIGTTFDLAKGKSCARLVWHLDQLGSERLTLAGSPGSARADISDLCRDPFCDRRSSYWVTVIAPCMLTELERRREELASSVWTFPEAQTFYRRLVPIPFK